MGITSRQIPRCAGRYHLTQDCQRRADADDGRTGIRIFAGQGNVIMERETESISLALPSSSSSDCRRARARGRRGSEGVRERMNYNFGDLADACRQMDGWADRQGATGERRQAAGRCAAAATASHADMSTDWEWPRVAVGGGRRIEVGR